MPEAPVYARPATLGDALALLGDLGEEATVVAGGQDLVPLVNQGRLHPRVLIDLKALDELAQIRVEDGALRIGARVTHRAIERSPLVRESCGLLAEAAGLIGGGIQVRNRGTIGGAICTGNPAYDYAASLVALDAQIELRSAAGAREVPAQAFFVDAHRTARRSDELLTEIRVPVGRVPTGWAYEKLKFTDGCYCVAGVACLVSLGDDGSYRDLRLAVGGATPVPARLGAAEAVARGGRPSEAVLRKVDAAAAAGVTAPLADVMADGEYRRAMTGVLAARALGRATRRAGAG